MLLVGRHFAFPVLQCRNRPYGGTIHWQLDRRDRTFAHNPRLLGTLHIPAPRHRHGLLLQPQPHPLFILAKSEGSFGLATRHYRDGFILSTHQSGRQKEHWKLCLMHTQLLAFSAHFLCWICKPLIHYISIPVLLFLFLGLIPHFQELRI